MHSLVSAPPQRHEGRAGDRVRVLRGPHSAQRARRVLVRARDDLRLFKFDVLLSRFVAWDLFICNGVLMFSQEFRPLLHPCGMHLRRVLPYAQLQRVQPRALAPRLQLQGGSR